MKKSYLITYFYTGKESHLSQIVEVMDCIGRKNAIQQTARSYSVILVPDEEGIDASEIRKRIAERINPFDENVAVARIVPTDYSETDGVGCGKAIEGCYDGSGEEVRNFNRFYNMIDAKRAYEMENPRWVYPDGIGVSTKVDFVEWCWLPIRKDGIYEKNGKYDKYLNR